MTDYRTILEHDLARVGHAGFAFDDVIRRRDRKRRNQRVRAGTVGFAVFLLAVWVVTSGLSFDRTQTPAVPAVTGPANRTAQTDRRRTTFAMARDREGHRRRRIVYGRLGRRRRRGRRGHVRP
jgi:hypothetical protein